MTTAVLICKSRTSSVDLEWPWMVKTCMQSLVIIHKVICKGRKGRLVSVVLHYLLQRKNVANVMKALLCHLRPIFFITLALKPAQPRTKPQFTPEFNTSFFAYTRYLQKNWRTQVHQLWHVEPGFLPVYSISVYRHQQLKQSTCLSISLADRSNSPV